jgi:hypothetical protein
LLAREREFIAAQEARIENEHGNHRRRIAQRVMQRDVIGQAQIAPQPPDHSTHQDS